MKTLLRVALGINIVFGMVYIFAFSNQMVTIKYEFEDPSYNYPDSVVTKLYQANYAHLVANVLLVLLNLLIVAIILMKMKKQAVK